MLVNDFDDERTLEEEEAMDSGGDSAGNELDDLQKVWSLFIFIFIDFRIFSYF